MSVKLTAAAIYEESTLDDQVCYARSQPLYIGEWPPSLVTKSHQCVYPRLFATVVRFHFITV